MEADVSVSPLAETICDKAAKHTVYTTLDSRQGHINSFRRGLTSYYCLLAGGRSLLMYNRSSFETKDSFLEVYWKFQRVIEATNREEYFEVMPKYIDNILISSESMKEHVEHVSTLLACMQLTQEPQRLLFGAEHCQFLYLWPAPATGAPLCHVAAVL